MLLIFFNKIDNIISFLENQSRLNLWSLKFINLFITFYLILVYEFFSLRSPANDINDRLNKLTNLYNNNLYIIEWMLSLIEYIYIDSRQ